MHHFFVTQGPDADGVVRVTGADVNHIRNVLRMGPGEAVVISDGGDRDWYCRITKICADAVELSVTSESEIRELSAGIDLFQGLPKADKMELIIQKAVELGARQVVPVEMKRSIVRLDEKKKESRRKRWQAISESAAKQCGRAMIPDVGDIVSLAEAIRTLGGYDMILVPYENKEGMAATKAAIDALSPGMSVAVFIGPEGGFDPSEIDALEAAGARTISLGKRILRTETAGLVALSWCMLHLECEGEPNGSIS